MTYLRDVGYINALKDDGIAVPEERFEVLAVV
jgi:hypothetical protein